MSIVRQPGPQPALYVQAYLSGDQMHVEECHEATDEKQHR